MKRRNLLATASRVAGYFPRSVYYLRRFGRHKAANALLAEAERLARRTRLRSKPYWYYIDPCDVCNLRCPLCATGNGLKQNARGMMKLQDYRRILEKVHRYAIRIQLYSWGEPLLNKEIFDLIHLTRRYGIAHALSSNLNVEKEHLGDLLVESGLDRLIVSLDGVTQEVYQQYRVRGDIGLVFRNLRAIVEARRRLQSRTPIVEWQFIVFRHNEHEMKPAQRLAGELGIEFRPVFPVLPRERYSLIASPEQTAAETEWMPLNRAFWQMNPAVMRRDGFLFEQACSFLYRTMFVNPKGGVTPCCFAYQERDEFGCLLHDDLETVWNSHSYQKSRALFARKPIAAAHTLCDGCFIYKRPVVR
ncbi:MAG: radical SAM protein [Chloroflexi bacterium]|nr:radical SAM protein [Chloroflexota bacterium]MCI0578585.1 radical SAM protein [Chloroflexota bacterium]MCI0647344.1 radical SAM protein [Chloroflexota bacterium]MCI0727804.1 radical SAM protein [Chloroflexota bacterium]